MDDKTIEETIGRIARDLLVEPPVADKEQINMTKAVRIGKIGSEDLALIETKTLDAIVKHFEQQRKELNQLKALLPKTADGVAMHPFMTVFIPYLKDGSGDFRTIGFVGAKMSYYIESQQTLGEIGVRNKSAFSTKEAAVSAIKQEV